MDILIFVASALATALALLGLATIIVAARAERIQSRLSPPPTPPAPGDVAPAGRFRRRARQRSSARR